MKKESGQAVVEMALVLPILLFLLLGVIEMAIIGYAYITVQNAISSGGNIAAIGGTDTQIEKAIDKASTGLETDKITISIDRSNPTDVKVSLTYSVNVGIPVIPGIDNPFIITSTLTEEIQ